MKRNQTKEHADGDLLGNDVVVNNTAAEDEARPCCEHGPCLLFERFYHNRPSRKFYACSACRDRKECDFFQWYDEKQTNGKRLVQTETQLLLQEYAKERKKMMRTLRAARKSKFQDIYYCLECNQLCDGNTCSSCGGKHVKSVSKDFICSPSKHLKPLAEKKSNAQYLFTDSCCDFLISTLVSMKFKKVLCIGTPRLHESLLNSTAAQREGVESMLLDIDRRHANFYEPKQMCLYNMFNDYFFVANERANVEDFVKCSSPESVVLVMDPPFGGLMSILANTLATWSTIWAKVNKLAFYSHLPIMFVFPYFLESRVTDAMPSLLMSDYKVSYDNHVSYHNDASGLSKKRLSPVRLFTNISLEKLKLPIEEGYRFCQFCKKYVAENNPHCSKCNACRSKDGRTYVHCDNCSTCVKPGYVHCAKCNRCELPRHSCGSAPLPGMQLCHVCGQPGHKRSHCPTKDPKKQNPSKNGASSRDGGKATPMKKRKRPAK